MSIDPKETLERIYRKDPTLWKPAAAEHQQIIEQSLGWIDLVERMRPELDEIVSFAEDLRSQFDTVVLLGMGGSSLCPEVYRRVFGRREGWPELVVLDSVVPEAVREVERSLDLDRALFLLASKSGSTIEPMSLYKRFRGLLEEKGANAGEHFVAITDPGSPLEKMAGEKGFRRVFTNFADIGGRYSALSFFGMVPAALAGYDVHELLDHADDAFSACAPSVPPEANPAWLLGSLAGMSAVQGADKLTLILPESLESVGLWIEQLVAESTGKEGKGVVPIALEPRLPDQAYGSDRVFISTRFRGDEGSDWLDSLRGSHPVLELEIQDEPDVAWLFVVWELATAIMGSCLEINPFDQPNVEEAKIQAKRALSDPPEIPSGTVEEAGDLVASLGEGDYLGLLIYGAESDERNGSLSSIRERVGSRKIATTAGYGPRYLHSTGQLHKGGPEGGAFIVVTQDDRDPLQVHGESYSLNRLALAQAVGDRRALEAAGRRTVHVHGSIDEILEKLRATL